MAKPIESEVDVRDQTLTAFPVQKWIMANAAGLGITYGLFALLGDLAEYGLGVVHDSIERNGALLAAVLIGASVFVYLRQQVLADHVNNPRGLAVAAAAGLSFGLIVGFAVGGPPIDFVLGATTLGVVGGTSQWRSLRSRVHHPGRLLLASIGGWILAGISAGAVAFLGDPIHELIGAPKDGTFMGTVFFVFLLTAMGVVGGTVGGWIEGAALGRRL